MDKKTYKDDYSFKKDGKVYQVDSMYSKCIKEQNKHHEKQSDHGVIPQSKNK